MQIITFALILVLCSAAPSAWSQEIQVNRQNKTIAVLADGSVVVDPEVVLASHADHRSPGR